jgi:hypothetical protein
MLQITFIYKTLQKEFKYFNLKSEGVLYKQGILLSPASGAVLISLSTVVVAINAGLLKVRK